MSKFKLAMPKQSRTTLAALSLMETTVRTVLEQHLTPQLGDRDPSTDTEDDVPEKRNESSPAAQVKIWGVASREESEFSVAN